MPIWYGKSEDGSDAKEFEGFYVNPDNPNEWSNIPYPPKGMKSGQENRRERRKQKRKKNL